jgi:nucleotide-binding universal stress UspA family protein
METFAATADQQHEGAFRHVLVCLDRSEAAEGALPLATYVAATDRAQLTLVHVLDMPASAETVRATDAIGWEIARSEARRYLEGIGQRVAPLTRTCVAEGKSARRIVALAEELHADLIAITTHGEGGGGESYLGGTTEKVLALTEGSILLVPTTPRGDGARIPPRRILVPLDGARRSESVLPTAVRLARAAEAEIVLAHVVWEPMRTQILSRAEDLELARALMDRQEQSAADYLEGVCDGLTVDGVAARAVVRHSHDHREALLSLATAEQADLVILCAHGSVCNARRPFGSVTRYLIAHASAPLLVIQDIGDGARLSTPVPSSPAPRSPLPPRALDERGQG